jgi:alkylhydroperoxidase/carboxymuconolactone decarboxylase family protein YurZ
MSDEYYYRKKRSHAKAASKAGATKEEPAEAITAALSTGAVMAHRNFALDAEKE